MWNMTHECHVRILHRFHGDSHRWRYQLDRATWGRACRRTHRHRGGFRGQCRWHCWRQGVMGSWWERHQVIVEAHGSIMSIVYFNLCMCIPFWSSWLLGLRVVSPVQLVGTAKDIRWPTRDMPCHLPGESAHLGIAVFLGALSKHLGADHVKVWLTPRGEVTILAAIGQLGQNLQQLNQFVQKKRDKLNAARDVPEEDMPV